MKQARRQELRTNDLSVYLQQTYEWAQRNATYLIGGVVVVVLVLVISFWMQYSRHATREKGWKDYYSILREGSAEVAGSIERARTLAAEFSDDVDLGPVTLALQADLAYQKAMSLTSPLDQGQRVGLLEDAKQTYERVLAKYPKRPLIVVRTKMSLAAVLESLYMEGQGNLDGIRQIYQDLIDGPTNAFQSVASELQASLDERTKQLDIVPTPPLSTAPAASAVSATGPAAALGPATALTTAPAAAPAAGTPLKITPVRVTPTAPSE